MTSMLPDIRFYFNIYVISDGPTRSVLKTVFCILQTVQYTSYVSFKFVRMLAKQCHLHHPPVITIFWLVVWLPSPVGMMTFPIYGKIKHVPNHQPDI